MAPGWSQFVVFPGVRCCLRVNQKSGPLLSGWSLLSLSWQPSRQAALGLTAHRQMAVSKDKSRIPMLGQWREKGSAKETYSGSEPRASERNTLFLNPEAKKKNPASETIAKEIHFEPVSERNMP